MPLSKEDQRQLKKSLQELEKKITQTVQGCAAEVKKPDEATGYSQHQADQGTDDFDRRINIEVTTNEFLVLKQIKRALEKFEEGTYGLCDISGKEIPLKRLKVMPYANTTVEAQEMLERGLI